MFHPQQIRLVFLIWLPYFLRMSRPGEELELSCTAGPPKEKQQMPNVELKDRSSKSLIANVLDIDDDYRCNHRCTSGTLLHTPSAYYRTVNRWAIWMDDDMMRVITSQSFSSSLCRQGVEDNSYVHDSRSHDNIAHTCPNSSAEYELALILKELRWITDQVSEMIWFADRLSRCATPF